MKICKGYLFIINVFMIIVGHFSKNIIEKSATESLGSCPAKREQPTDDFLSNFEDKSSEQWPLSPWRESLPNGLRNSERKRRNSHDLVPVDLDSFRREIVGPKPQWRPPPQNVDKKKLRLKP